jgi:hypothetical protein
MGLLRISEGHWTTNTVFRPGEFTFTQQSVGTRYVMLALPTAGRHQSGDELWDQIKVT